MQAEQIADTYASSVRVGAPSTLGESETVQQFLAAVADGNYRETACRLAGIAKQTFYNWLKRAEAGDEAAIAFVDALEKAEATAEAGLVQNVRNASKSPQFWAAGMTLLERKSPEKWGRRQDDSAGPKVQVIIGASDSEVRVNVIANYQTQTDTEGTTLQPLTATPIDVSPSESEGRKLTAQAKVSRRVSRGGRRGARSGGGP